MNSSLKHAILTKNDFADFQVITLNINNKNTITRLKDISQVSGMLQLSWCYWFSNCKVYVVGKSEDVKRAISSEEACTLLDIYFN